MISVSERRARGVDGGDVILAELPGGITGASVMLSSINCYPYSVSVAFTPRVLIAVFISNMP